jgi:uncharacterized protein DUF3631
MAGHYWKFHGPHPPRQARNCVRISPSSLGILPAGSLKTNSSRLPLASFISQCASGLPDPLLSHEPAESTYAEFDLQTMKAKPAAADPVSLARSTRTEVDGRLNEAERAADIGAFIRALQTLAVEERAPQLSRLVALVAKCPRIEWSLWLEHAKNTLGWRPPASLAHVELSKLALMDEVLAPLAALSTEQLTAADLETALRDVVTAALRQSPDGTSMQQWLTFLKTETSRHVSALLVNGVTPAQLDAVVVSAFEQAAQKAVLSTTAASGLGEEIRLTNPEPWPEPVDGIALLDALVATIRRFVVHPPAATVAVALYIVLTHVYNSFDILPILVLKSPVKRCGKTRLITIVQHLVLRPLLTANITAPSLFRTIAAFGPALLIDEADTFVRFLEELRGLLNSGYTRSTAFAIRTVGDDHLPRAFSTWCPKILALIGKLSDTLEDRSIIVVMNRRTRDEPVDRLRLTALPRELEPLLRQVARWAQDHAPALRDSDPQVPEGLNDRAADNWCPLLAIADLVGGPWARRAREAALELSGDPEAETDESTGLQLLADLRDLFIVVGERPTEEVLQRLNALADHPWPQWNRGRPMTARQLASMLKPFGVKPRQLTRPINVKGYRAVDLRDAFARYLPPLAVPRPGGEAVDPKYPKSALETDHLASLWDPKQPVPASDAPSDVSSRKATQASDTSAASPGAPTSTSAPSAPVPRTPLRLPGPLPKREPGG